MSEHNITIGSRIKSLRTGKKYTLKQLSEESGLSIGFLSQLERGMSSIAIDSLAKLAEIFEVPLASFFDAPQRKQDNPVMQGFNLQPIEVSDQIVQFILSKDPERFAVLPRLFQLMPQKNPEDELEMYNHSGEEFIYLLEGIVSVYVGENEYTLYPGDSIQIRSNIDHNWINRTNKVARMLCYNYPNALTGERVEYKQENNIEKPEAII